MKMVFWNKVLLVSFCVLGVVLVGCEKEEQAETSVAEQNVDSLSESEVETESIAEKTIESANDGQDTGKSVEHQGFTLTWRVDGENLEVAVEAPTKGWVAVGFEPSSMMKDADYIIGYVTENEVFIRDDFGVGTASHKADTELGGSDDVSILGGSETNGNTSIQFSIPLQSGDEYDKVLEPGATYVVLLAYGNVDNVDSIHRKHAKIDITL
jgi:hypothetical protein